MSVRQRTYTSRRKVWIADVRVGFRRKRGNFSSHRDAKLAEAKWRQELDAGHYRAGEVPTFAQWIEIVLLEHVHDGEHRDAVRTERIIKSFLPEFGDKRLDKITSDHIQTYLQRLKSNGSGGRSHSAATYNRYRSWLNRVFSLAIQRGILSVNPVSAVTRYREVPRIRWLEPVEIRALLDACHELLKPIVVAAVNTGARQSELLGLCWSDVDFNREEITIRSQLAKSGYSRIIPMTKEVLNCLTLLHDQAGGAGPVFRRSDGEGWMRFPRRYWARALEVSGIEEAMEPRLDGFRFHDLRHTAATKLLEAGVDVSVVSAILGHSTVAFTARHYAHATNALKYQAIHKLELILSSDKPDT